MRLRRSSRSASSRSRSKARKARVRKARTARTHRPTISESAFPNPFRFLSPRPNLPPPARRPFRLMATTPMTRWPRVASRSFPFSTSKPYAARLTTGRTETRPGGVDRCRSASGCERPGSSGVVSCRLRADGPSLLPRRPFSRTRRSSARDALLSRDADRTRPRQAARCVDRRTVAEGSSSLLRSPSHSLRSQRSSRPRSTLVASDSASISR